MNTLSIDPGKQGAEVLIGGQGHVINWWPAPLTGKEYDGRKLAKILEMAESYIGGPLKVVIEGQGPRKITGKAACFSVGFGFGRWLQAIESADLPLKIIPPSEWTKAYKPKIKLSDKERKEHYVRLARNRYPRAFQWDLIPKYQQSGLADALLINDFVRTEK